MQFYASFAHNLERDAPRQDIHQMSQKLLWILHLLLFLHLRRMRRSAVAKGSVMDQFTSPTVPVLRSEAVLGLSRADADAERS